MRKAIIICVLTYSGLVYSNQNGSEIPVWLDEKIAEYKNKTKGNPPYSIYSLEYKGYMAFYTPAQCCDQYSALFDTNGKYICAPDGGYTGFGDGKCNDFSKEAKNKKLIWRDNR